MILSFLLSLLAAGVEIDFLAFLLCFLLLCFSSALGCVPGRDFICVEDHCGHWSVVMAFILTMEIFSLGVRGRLCSKGKWRAWLG